MNIGITNDHHGINLKHELTKYLTQLGYNVIDYGTNEEVKVDYPNYAYKLGNAINNNEILLGIALCKTGIGMSIALNKIKNIRCAKVNNIMEASLSKQHNNANVIALSSEIDLTTAEEITKTFLTTPFSNEERHINRINQISDLENA